MAVLMVNPRYRDLLARHGLTAAGRLLALPGAIVSGHPDRNVARVAVGGVGAYLKREHRVRRRDRLGSAWAGFGLVSKSVREARTLAALRRAGVGCPEWVAAGEEGGRAFLLVEDLADTLDLRQFLRDRRGPSAERYRFARRLGSALARVHEAGFDQPDLYAKHVLVDPHTEAIHFLDWQRSRRWGRFGRRRRAQDLAALDATLAEELATGRERLTCLRAYVTAWEPGAPAAGVMQFARDVRRRSERLLGRRRVRQERASPPPVAGQGVLWLDGEALCVTQEFWADLAGTVPSWLPLPSAAAPGDQVVRAVVHLPGGRRGLLVRRWCDRPLAWLWSLLRQRPLLSPELREAGALFRRRKHGLGGARVLAFGQRRPRPWRTESFLLTEVARPDGGRLP
jgi:tRNA A-37 threonylcarbamoyl transferase component Bud32